METVKTFSSEAEAHLASSKLGSMGIQSKVHRFSRYRALSSGGYLLKVTTRDMPRARTVLGAVEREIDMDEYVDPDDVSYPRCPACSSVNICPAPLTRKQTLIAVLLLGLPLFLIKRDWSCRKCRHAWQA